ncbi:hypothetical protein AB0K92_30575 [Streptomyces sp. NPDC052687]|uniref:hypothetical protein n=1 Tax=Streptomyces sp. NPDC052687 TaxID=3154759 RepID=UPI003417647E
MGVPVSRVIRPVVSEHAPGERDLLDAVEGMTPRDRRRHLAEMGRAPSTSTVDFGLEVVVPLVTPVLWLVLTETAREAAATAVRASAQAARSRWRRWRGRAPEDEPEIPLPLSAEQLGVVREAVLTQCVETGLSPDRATAIANAVFYELSTATGREDPSGQDEPTGRGRSLGQGEPADRDRSSGQGGSADRDRSPGQSESADRVSSAGQGEPEGQGGTAEGDGGGRDSR